MHQPIDQDRAASAESTAATDDILGLSAVVFDQEFHFCSQLHGDWRDALRETVCDSVGYEVSLLGIDDLHFEGDRRLLEQLHTRNPPRDVNDLLASLRTRVGPRTSDTSSPVSGNGAHRPTRPGSRSSRRKRGTLMKESPHVPFYFNLPPLQQPPPALIGDSETYLLGMIHRGMLLVSTYHASDGLGQQVRVYQPASPFWEEPETYYDAITDILQAADYAGLDPHLLCRQAIDNQLGLKEEAQQHANNLRGPGRRRAAASGPKEATVQDFGRNIERSKHHER